MKREYERGVVSICLPVYNGGESLKRSLDSLLNQTYKNIELIISDNASIDGTEALCKEYAAKDSRIRYIRHPKNIMQLPNTEFVMKEARGEYMMLAGDDDWWDKTFIEKAKVFLDTHLNFGAAQHSVRRQYLDGEIKSEVHYQGELDLTYKSYAEVFDMMSSEKPIHWFAGLFRTFIMHNLLRTPFPDSKAPDRIFMCELALTTHIATFPEILYHKTVYRVHASERDKYKDEAVGASYRNKKAHSRYVFAMLKRLILSPNVPLLRKLWIYPYHLSAFVWRNRVFLREWFPRTFTFALKTKAAARKGLHNSKYV
jgi:glycosyltransferase involved in cell wall biosynthesis